jgi:hypothetical protein
LDELICIFLGFAPCRKGVERLVSYFLIFGDIPAESSWALGIGRYGDRVRMVLWHDVNMGRAAKER